MTADTRIEDWDSYNGALRERGKEFAVLHPEAVKGFSALSRGASTTKHLDAKTRELIALAVAVTTRCQGCIDAHARKAQAAGLTKEEIAEALGVAIALNAGAAMTYSLHVLDAMDGLG
ncbi:carboxymuconolactone decarboxylase family protein [Roseococcus sp. XZZS9]|uniref:Carboxymuconolactone decarboxylase family protein n=1 Tax=Roseococcus pinisoli TaxID=2835040 RepID=A0ABS5Q9Q8_9PROT|nr:carboxymuconolactone decarboxylase family protein [Roseococcus pinisoli]MBS7809690.1 carboxymuconolactone decarboxylase family protein [Roseococcus pinisoli]